MSGPGFVHLHVHSSYSLLQGALKIEKLEKLATADQQPALALTDTNNLFGALEFSEKMAKAGIQPIIGIELEVDFADRPVPRHRISLVPETRGSVVLLAASNEGYQNLMALSSRAFLETPSGEGIHLPVSAFQGATGGVMRLTAGALARSTGASCSAAWISPCARLAALQALFPDRLYLELERFGLREARATENALLELASDARLPVAAANNVHFGLPGISKRMMPCSASRRG